MNSQNKSASGIIKGMMIGIALGTAATIAITNKDEIAKKVKKAAESATDNISSMFGSN